MSINELDSFEYSFSIKSCPVSASLASCLGQMYLNIYTESVANNVCTFFDCRFYVVLRGIVYNSSTKGKYSNTNEIGTTESTENCETEKKNTEVQNDKKYLSTM